MAIADRPLPARDARGAAQRRVDDFLKSHAEAATSPRPTSACCAGCAAIPRSARREGLPGTRHHHRQPVPGAAQAGVAGGRGFGERTWQKGCSAGRAVAAPTCGPPGWRSRAASRAWHRAAAGTTLAGSRGPHPAPLRLSRSPSAGRRSRPSRAWPPLGLRHSGSFGSPPTARRLLLGTISFMPDSLPSHESRRPLPPSIVSTRT